ncbi:protein FAM151A [Ambystoma mexicanum]|uniref:protein FAM151A n=1 Tax=Ambystoma mexicanum TaxID=8296 RepID=UPI0037E7C289
MLAWKECNGLRTAAGVSVFVAVCIAIAVVCVTVGRNPSKDSIRKPSFNTDGDLLNFLLSQGKIDKRDGLLVTWYHAANRKSDLDKALKDNSMVLEADVNLEGLNTINETKTPIMAHPPDVYSDNTLEAWLGAVLDSTKGIKLDFKSIKAVGPSLDILNKTSLKVKLNRPVWINADIVRGPNVYINIAVNATQFLRLVQDKYPNVTISPGWVTLYVPELPKNTYTWDMIQEMYGVIRNLTQPITFPVRAVMAKSAWPHFRWLLQMSTRYSMTLWQGAKDPVTVEDLLYIRDNNHPEAVYYDINEPTLSQFKDIAMNPKRKRMFYSGGSLQKFFHPEDSDAVLIGWYEIESKTALLMLLQNRSGMIVLDVGVNSSRADLDPLVYLSNSADVLSLENCLDLVYTSANLWGVFLKVKTEAALGPTLSLLSRLYKSSLLFNPIWISMDVSFGRFNTPGYIQGSVFIKTINTVFPYVTIAPSWPKEVLSNGYTEPLVEDMLQLLEGLWQDVSFQLQAVPLGKIWKPATKLLEVSSCYTITVEHKPSQGAFFDGYSGLVAIRSHTATSVYYKLPREYRDLFFVSIYNS